PSRHAAVRVLRPRRLALQRERSWEQLRPGVRALPWFVASDLVVARVVDTGRPSAGWIEPCPVGSRISAAVRGGRMIQRVTIAFQVGVRDEVWKHLRSNADGDEDAAFLFADAEPTARGVTLHVRGWYGVVDDDFDARGLAGIELSDACRAAMFKRAHDEG